MWKLIYQIKWLHYQKRAEIFDRAYGYVHESYKRESKKVGDVYMHLIAELEAVINQKYLTVAADLKQAVSGLFNPSNPISFLAPADSRCALFLLRHRSYI